MNQLGMCLRLVLRVIISRTFDVTFCRSEQVSVNEKQNASDVAVLHCPFHSVPSASKQLVSNVPKRSRCNVNSDSTAMETMNTEVWKSCSLGKIDSL